MLILDEPTSGLDPNQIIEVRHLIERLGQEHTVILSTHYLQEVEKSASRVIVIHQGEIVADDTRDNLVASMPASVITVHVRAPLEALQRQFHELLPGRKVVIETLADDSLRLRVEVGTGTAPLEESIARLVVKNNWSLLELLRERPSLEDVFRKLTMPPTAANNDAAAAGTGEVARA